MNLNCDENLPIWRKRKKRVSAVDIIWSTTQSDQLLQQLNSTGFSVLIELVGAGTLDVPEPITILGHK